MTRPDTAFILAAGMGSRLRPYTDHCPKPLVSVAGLPIIGHVLDRLKQAGVRRVTVNLHYRADQLAAWLKNYEDIEIATSFEPELLDTGGGIKKALPDTANDEPFYIVSGDSFWTDGAAPALQNLAQAWDARAMDMLLLLQPVGRMTLTPGLGDYDVRNDGRAVRSHDKTGAYMWTSVRLCTRSLFLETPDGAFSFLGLLDRAEQAGRLHARVHDGDWYHITTPDDLERVDAALSKG